MLHSTSVILCASVALAQSVFVAAPAAAQTPAEFYKGKTISLLMGTNPGGSYDLYGRVLGEYLSRHIPGNPNIIMEHMPGAGGVIAGNHLYGPGPQDGTKILLSHSIPLAEKLEPKGVRFESTKLQWLGTFDAIAHTMAVWHEPQVNTIDALKTRPLVIGSFGKGHLTYQWPAMMKHVLGTNYQVITGYRSGSDSTWRWSAAKSMAGPPPGRTWRAPGRSGSRRRRFQCWCRSRSSASSRSRTCRRCSNSRRPIKKDVVEFLAAGTPFGRAMAVGPGVPADRVAVLRKAFDDVMKDPAFLAEAEKRKLDIDPRPASYPHALADKLASASPELLARVKKAIGQTE